MATQAIEADPNWGEWFLARKSDRERESRLTSFLSLHKLLITDAGANMYIFENQGVQTLVLVIFRRDAIRLLLSECSTNQPFDVSQFQNKPTHLKMSLRASGLELENCLLIQPNKPMLWRSLRWLSRGLHFNNYHTIMRTQEQLMLNEASWGKLMELIMMRIETVWNMVINAEIVEKLNWDRNCNCDM